MTAMNPDATNGPQKGDQSKDTDSIQARRVDELVATTKINSVKEAQEFANRFADDFIKYATNIRRLLSESSKPEDFLPQSEDRLKLSFLLELCDLYDFAELNPAELEKHEMPPVEFKERVLDIVHDSKESVVEAFQVFGRLTAVNDRMRDDFAVWMRAGERILKDMESSFTTRASVWKALPEPKTDDDLREAYKVLVAFDARIVILKGVNHRLISDQIEIQIEQARLDNLFQIALS